MVVALPPVAVGMLWYGLIVASPLVIFWVAVQVPKVIDELRDRRAMRLRANQAQGPPLERLATDLRRLRTELITQPPTNNVRRTALLSAYDSVLVDTCARLGIPTELPTVTIGPDRELERLRAEAAIEEAGVPLQPARP